MIDNNRGTGRTTRMVLAAYNYVLKTHNYPNPPKVEIVVHSQVMVAHVHNMISCIIPDEFKHRFDVKTRVAFLSKGRGVVESTFFDHHVHYVQACTRKGNIETLEARLAQERQEFDNLIEKMNEY